MRLKYRVEISTLKKVKKDRGIDSIATVVVSGDSICDAISKVKDDPVYKSINKDHGEPAIVKVEIHK